MITDQVNRPDAEEKKSGGDGYDRGADHDEAPITHGRIIPRAVQLICTRRQSSYLEASPLAVTEVTKVRMLEDETRKKRPVSGRFEVWRFR
jgi:hypothetical protein